MGTDRELVQRHVEALIEAAAAAGVPADVAARLLLQEVVEIWKRDRPLDDISSELKFVADNLDPDTDFEFMRP